MFALRPGSQWVEAGGRRETEEEKREGISNVPHRCALYALSKLSFHAEGAEAVVESNALHDAATHLNSPVIDIRKFACELLGHVAQHEETLSWVVSIDPCPKLVSMLSDTSLDVSRSADGALARISIWPDGAAAVGAAKAVDGALPFAESPYEQRDLSIAEMISNLLRHRQAKYTLGTLSVGEIVANFNVDSSGRAHADNLRLHAPSDSAEGLHVPEALRDIARLLASTADRPLVSNLRESLDSFLLSGLEDKDKDVGRYMLVYR
ncbi:hypothetical protein B0H19DRAFT_1256270 [Mycena capillaripes]|nr:hypothetical protein B0H19DRAFT_1256270 [Mycena capillaripes]